MLVNTDVGLLSEAGFCIPTLGNKPINDSNKTTTVSLRQNQLHHCWNGSGKRWGVSILVSPIATATRDGPLPRRWPCPSGRLCLGDRVVRMLPAGAVPRLSGPRHRVPKRAQPPWKSLPSEFSPGQSLVCKRSASKARAWVTPPGCYRLPSGTPVEQSARCRRANMPGLPLSDSPVSKLGNLLFPNLFSFSGTQSSLRFQDSKDLIQLLVHTCISLPAQQMPAKPLIFREKEDGAVPGAPAAACPPAEPRRAVTRSPAVPSRSLSPVPGSCRPQIAPRANAAPGG